jgi:D-galactarolactone cycloisomerase
VTVRARIASVDAFVVVGNKDYAGDAGLHAVAPTQAAPAGRALAAVGDLRVCAYPTRVQSCVLKITADDGTVGWGEAHAPLGGRATQAIVYDVLAPLLVGDDPLAIDRHWERMYGSMRLRGHVAGFQLEAIAGVDIALWDLTGKLLELPVYRLLGGPYRVELPTYASGVPGATVDERVESAKRLVDEGYSTLKTSIGRGNTDTDLAGVDAVVQAVRGRADVLVDAHGAYTADNGLYVGRQLERTGVYWLEDPLPPEDIEGYIRLSAELDMPVAAGETECTRWQFDERLRCRAVDVILPDVCRAGGISEGRRIATVASLHNTRWAAHVSMGTSIHVAAAAHLAAASANFLILEFSSTPNPLGDVLLREPLRPERGVLRVPDGPGLGIQFDEERLQAHIVEDQA